jgi:hypothetical protein
VEVVPLSRELEVVIVAPLDHAESLVVRDQLHPLQDVIGDAGTAIRKPVAGIERGERVDSIRGIEDHLYAS